MAISNGYTYTPDSPSAGNCTITDYTPASSSHGTDPVIPSALDGYNVTNIADNAFASKSLTSVTFNNVVDIGDNSFYNNSGITVAVNADITTNACSSINTPPFEDCVIGANFSFDSSVTTIPRYLFARAGLTGTFSTWSNLTTIVRESFYNCSLTQVNINHSVDIGTFAFYSNAGLELNVTANFTTNTILSVSGAPFYSCNIDDKLTLTGITIIDDFSFAYAGITEVTFPSTITTIADYAFYENELTTFETWSNLTLIESRAFGRNDLTTINLIHAVDLKSEIFYQNSVVPNVYINANITTNTGTSHNSAPFGGDMEINLTIGSSYTTIDKYTFAHTQFSDTEMIFPETLTFVDEYAFYDSNLTLLSLHENFTEIEIWSFAYNENLADVYMYNDSMVIGSNCLYDNMSDISPGTIYGDSGSTAETFAGTISNYVFSLLEPEQYLTHDVDILLLEFDEVDTAEAGTDTDTIVMTGHGLSVDDYIVNTTRRGTNQADQERGSRRVVTVTDANTVELNSAISGQTSTDSIRKYNFNNINSYVDINSIKLNLTAEKESNTLNFVMTSPTSAVTGIEKLPNKGQLVKCVIDDECWFAGIITNVSYHSTDEAVGAIKINVTASTLNVRLNHRTIFIDYDKDEATDDIIDDMLVYMEQEGIEAGTIDSGVDISEDWKNDCCSIREVTDECSSKNEFQLFIDELFQMNFYQDPASIEDCIRTIELGDEFTDFRELNVSDNLSDYSNKSFFIGGKDVDGNDVFVINGDGTEQNAIQDITAGSGVFGKITRNTSITERESYTALAGTTTTNITITAHNFAVGSLLRNRTRGSYAYVTAIVDANNVTVTTVASQTSGDTIVYCRTANNIASNILNKDKKSRQLRFKCFDMTFKPQQKLYVDLPQLNLDEVYFNIESVVISDAGRGYFTQEVTAIERDNSNFSTQRRKNTLSDVLKEL